MFADRVLVTCPTAKVKDYALENYLKSFVEMREHLGKNGMESDLMMVDTTPSPSDYYDKLMDNEDPDINVCRYPINAGIPVEYLVTEVWEEVILPYVDELPYEWVAHIESDVICSHDMLTFLITEADRLGADVVSHSYNGRDGNEMIFDRSIGCFLWRKGVFKVGDSFSDSAESFARQLAYSRGHKTVEFTGMRPIFHI